MDPSTVTLTRALTREQNQEALSSCHRSHIERRNPSRTISSLRNWTCVSRRRFVIEADLETGVLKLPSACPLLSESGCKGKSFEEHTQQQVRSEYQEVRPPVPGVHVRAAARGGCRYHCRCRSNRMSDISGGDR